jgi:hypothetical protein
MTYSTDPPPLRAAVVNDSRAEHRRHPCYLVRMTLTFSLCGGGN